MKRSKKSRKEARRARRHATPMDKIQRLKKKFAGLTLDSRLQLCDETRARPMDLTISLPVIFAPKNDGRPEAPFDGEVPFDGELSEEQMRAVVQRMERTLVRRKS